MPIFATALSPSQADFFSLSWEESKGLDVCQEQWKTENGQGSEDRL